MNRLQPWRTGLALALTASALYLVCGLVYTLWPEPTLGFFNAWFHGLDFRLLLPPDGKPLSPRLFVYGLAGLATTSFVAGALFAFIYERLPRARTG